MNLRKGEVSSHIVDERSQYLLAEFLAAAARLLTTPLSRIHAFHVIGSVYPNSQATMAWLQQVVPLALEGFRFQVDDKDKAFANFGLALSPMLQDGLHIAAKLKPVGSTPQRTAFIRRMYRLSTVAFFNNEPSD